ncbi:MAG: hypothetical protein ACR2IF_14635 [Terriglobales bacterium]
MPTVGCTLEDFWTICLVAWLPIGGILLALCLYDLTSGEAEGLLNDRSRGGSAYGDSLDLE